MLKVFIAGLPNKEKIVDFDRRSFISNIKYFQHTLTYNLTNASFYSKPGYRTSYSDSTAVRPNVDLYTTSRQVHTLCIPNKPNLSRKSRKMRSGKKVLILD